MEPKEEDLVKMKWVERNLLQCASRVVRLMHKEKFSIRTEDMLSVCGDLVDLDTTCLSLKIARHVSECSSKSRRKQRRLDMRHK